jgi:S1-C subfamily serine protease
VRGLSEEQRKQVPPVQGVVIDNVFDPSPAVVAGIQIGDILQSMNGEKITNVFDFQRVLYRLGSGTRVKLGLRRGTRTVEGTTTITTRPREATTR